MPERSAAPRAASESERRVKVKVVEIADGALTGGGIDEDAHLKFRMGNLHAEIRVHTCEMHSEKSERSSRDSNLQKI